jgi:hypothetical protein
MGGLLTARARRRAAAAAALALLVGFGAASPALAAAPACSFAPPIAGVGSLLGGIAHAVLGGVDWTVNVAGDFILNLLGGLIRDLIPRSWIRKGLDIMGWLVAVSDYSGRVSAPGGGHAYGFAGVNAMRGLYTWLGMAIAPLTLVYATSRSWSGQGDPPHVPLTRVLIVAIALLNYTWLWSQAVALTNQITHAILSVPAVTSGVQKMFEVLIAGVALSGLPLIGLLVMGAGGLQLIALIFVKVTLILVGALVFAVGPLMIGLVATERGNAFARAWLTMALGLFVLPILWASIFAISAVLINDASVGASVLGGDSGLGHVLGGLLIALAAIAGLWLNIKLTRGFAGLVGGQLAGLLALAGGSARAVLGAASHAGSSTAAAGAGTAASATGSLRGFALRVGGGAGGVGGALVAAGRGGAALAGAGAGAGVLARGGLLGAGGALASKAIAGAARSSVGRAAASSRAGSVATRAARGARSGASARAASGGEASSADTVKIGEYTFATDAYQRTIDEQNRRWAARDTAPGAGASAAAPPGGAPGGASRQPPGGRVRTPPGSPSRRAPRDTPPPGGSGSPGAGSSITSDPANDVARDAFGQQGAAKPTRSLRHPFKGREGS